MKETAYAVHLEMKKVKSSKQLRGLKLAHGSFTMAPSCRRRRMTLVFTMTIVIAASGMQ